MRLRRKELQIFSMSFLDVISCALGGTLLLLLITMEQSAQRADAARRENARLKSAAAAASAELAEAKKKVRESEEAKSAVEAAMTSLVGLEGDFTNVVFIFDISGSMATPDLDSYKGTLASWLSGLPFKKFNVLAFNDQVRSWRKRQLVAGTDPNREAAISFVERLAPENTTATLAVLQEALSQPGVDTIVLMSDGAPVDAEPAEIIAWLRTNAKDVTINSVAMGEYFQKEYGDFLSQIADEHNGSFIGL